MPSTRLVVTRKPMPQERSYSLHVVLRPASDLPGQWVAHCLDVDVVTYGDSPRHALEMSKEAVEMVFVDDLIANREPLDRRAPRQYWDELWKRLMPGTVARPLEEVLGDTRTLRYAVIQGTLTAWQVSPSDTATDVEREPQFDAPVANALMSAHCCA